MNKDSEIKTNNINRLGKCEPPILFICVAYDISSHTMFNARLKVSVIIYEMKYYISHVVVIRCFYAKNIKRCNKFYNKSHMSTINS